MIDELSVKNFALIKEANIEFRNNLNILTGETGSGKSILIGSINLALGKRASRELMRNEDEDTIVSIVFSEKNESTLEKLKQMDISIDEDGKIVIYRKITKDKNIAKINDVPCTLNKIKEVTELLIDIYGQHDSDDLRKNAKHIEFLDEYIGRAVEKYKKNIEVFYNDLKNTTKKYESFNMDENMRLREIDLLSYEIEELENANIKPDEEEELEKEFKILSNAKNIKENLYKTQEILENANLSSAISEIKSANKYDESLKKILDSLFDAESIVDDNLKEIDRTISKYDVDEERLDIVTKRLNLIRNILQKYNNSIEKAINSLKEKKERLTILTNYETEKENLLNKINEIKEKLNIECEKLSSLRKEKAINFEKELINELVELGFLDVRFNISFDKKENPTLDGFDDVSFNISLNTGEKMRNLSDVASGGELSRIMLSIKTILSNSFNTSSLIFDEIDAGISGMTAGKVATKLNKISKNHQVICITHLPQIAAMADNHFVIKKTVENDRTITSITDLDMDGMIKEIGRLIGSNENLTDTVLANAKELKDMAIKEKEYE